MNKYLKDELLDVEELTNETDYISNRLRDGEVLAEILGIDTTSITEFIHNTFTTEDDVYQYLNNHVSDKKVQRELIKTLNHIEATERKNNKVNHLKNNGFKPIPLAEGKKIPKEGIRWGSNTFTAKDFSIADNIGIRTGTKHTLIDTVFNKYDTDYYLTVVDVDTPNVETQIKIIAEIEQRCGETYKVDTGGRHQGVHLYYFTDRTLDKKEVFKISETEQIEVLANEKYYVVAEGSKVLSEYTSNQRLDPEEIPHTSMDELVTILAKYTETNTPQNTIQSIKKSVESKEEEQEKQNANNVDMGKRIQITNNQTIYRLVVCNSSIPNSSYIPLSSSESLWESLLTEYSKCIYGATWTYKGIGKPFRCLLHKETNPSAILYRRKDGVIVYHDFHNSKSFDVIQFFEYMQNKERKEPVITSDRKWLKWWSAKLKEYIDLHQIDTGFSVPIHSYVSNNDFSFMTDKHNFVLKALEHFACLDMNKGELDFIASTRKVAELTGLATDEVNRIMNQFCYLGILQKGDKVKTVNGFTYRYTFVCEDIAEVRDRYNHLKEVGLLSLRNFSKAKVSERLGEDIAAAIFRRKPDNKIAPEVLPEPQTEEPKREEVPQEMYLSYPNLAYTHTQGDIIDNTSYYLRC